MSGETGVLSDPERVNDDFQREETMTKTSTHMLADFAANLSLADLDATTIKNSKMAVLDAVGCGVAGASDPSVDILKRSLIQWGEAGRTPVFASSARFSPRAAALINGAMMHALEMDDTHSFSSVHAGGPVVSSALSTCFAKGANGAGFIEAVVLGYEIACRLGIAIRGENPYSRGFHPTGICGVFGAATASGKIMGLDSTGYLNAWGIAGSMACGLMAYLQNGAWT
ncbi:MAG: MmgE/PrpD family protein, partial [Deltaproteobacteria bacterium]|nr:MmgE/PrpD family protein [Deltaproteobacteria bacterium]